MTNSRGISMAQAYGSNLKQTGSASVRCMWPAVPTKHVWSSYCAQGFVSRVREALGGGHCKPAAFWMFQSREWRAVNRMTGGWSNYQVFQGDAGGVEGERRGFSLPRLVGRKGQGVHWT